MSCGPGNGTPPNCQCLAENASYKNSSGTCSCIQNATLINNGKQCKCDDGYPFVDADGTRCITAAEADAAIKSQPLPPEILAPIVVIGVLVVGALAFGAYRSLSASAPVAPSPVSSRAPIILAPARMTSENGGPEDGSVGGASMEWSNPSLLTARLSISSFT